MRSPVSEWTFENDDKLNLKPYASALRTYIDIDRHFVTGSLVISLEAPFGSGKSTFLSMWKNLLDQQKDSSGKSFKSFLVNAWEDDFCGDPLLSLVDAFVEFGNSSSEQEQNLLSKLSKVAKTISWAAIATANSYVASKTGHDIMDIGDMVDRKLESPSVSRPDAIDVFRYKKRVLRELKSALRESFESRDEPVVVLVDELDRCRPDYAIAYLETIKHVFDVPGLVFLLAIDRGQLENSARALFGSQVNVDEYLRKFIHRSIKLPDMTTQHIRHLCEAFAKLFVNVDGKRGSLIGAHTASLYELCESLPLAPRQYETLFRTLGYLFSSNETPKSVSPSFSILVIFLCVLKLYDRSAYDKLARLELELGSLLRIINKIQKKRLALNLVALYHSALPNHKKIPPGILESELKQTSFYDSDDNRSLVVLIQDYSSGWFGADGDTIRSAVDLIESGWSLTNRHAL